MLNKISFLVFATFLGIASSQNCGIIGEDGSAPIVLPAVTESQAPGAVLSSLPIYNVSSTGAAASPHARYLRVLRYESRYEIQSADPFPEFVQTERTQLLIRDVFFTCSDGVRIPYTIHLPIQDENTESPVFNEIQYNATVTAPAPGSIVVVDVGIFVSDADVDKSNANLVLRSSNARMLPSVVEVANNNAFLYKFDLLIPDEVDVGEYQVILTADDGKHAASAVLNLTVQPNN